MSTSTPQRSTTTTTLGKMDYTKNCWCFLFFFVFLISLCIWCSCLFLSHVKFACMLVLQHIYPTHPLVFQTLNDFRTFFGLPFPIVPTPYSLHLLCVSSNTLILFVCSRSIKKLPKLCRPSHNQLIVNIKQW